MTRFPAFLRCAAVVAVGLAYVPAPAATQERPDTARPRIGLALSGGSAKGFAHLGVIEALEELGVPIDIVTGVSMGGLVGGLYATGYRPAEIVEVAKRQDWTALFTDAPERGLLTPDRRVLSARTVLEVPLQGGRIGLPGGVVRGQNILRLLQRLTWQSQLVRDFRKLPRDFSAIAANLETGEPVVLDSGVLAEALRATISLPGGIEPYRMNGDLLIDGGVARNLPAEDALALGADIVICSDVTEDPDSADELSSAFDILMQVVALTLESGTEPQRQFCDVLIRPDVKALSSLSFEQVEEWMRRGRVAAMEHAERLRAYAQPGRDGLDRSAFRKYLPDSVVVRDIVITGVGEDARRIAMRAINLREPTFVSADKLDEALARLYATDLFSQAIYRLEPNEGDTTLVFELRQEPRNELGFGFRYDDHRKASLLLTGTIHNVLRYGSTLLLEWRLGDESLLGARFLPRLGLVSPISTGADLRHTRAVFDIYSDGQRVAEVRSRVTEASALFGAALGRSVIFGLRPGLEYADAKTTISPADTSQKQTHGVLFASIFGNTLDREAYPSRGMSLILQSGFAAGLGNDGGYTQSYGSLEAVAPISRRTSVRARAILGVASGDDLPFHRFFYLGGAYPSTIFAESRAPFWGLRPEERVGKGVQVFRLSLQQAIRNRFYLTVGGNAGNVFSEWSFQPDDYITGWGVALGASTAIGPIEITAHGRSFDERPHLDFNIGFYF